MIKVPHDRRFLFSYEFRGATYQVEIAAGSAAEAQMRLDRMASAHFDGEVMLAIPVAVRPAQKLLRLWGAWRSQSRSRG